MIIAYIRLGNQIETDYHTILESVESVLEKPELEDEKIVNCLRADYGLRIEKISFLPLGADLNTAVYRAVTKEGTNYFVKLRQGDFNPASVTIPNYLRESGIKQIIPALTTRTGQFWATLNPFTVILYPFVEGEHGFEKKLSKAHWVEFGAALKRFHTTDIPAVLTGSIPTDKFSRHWRDKVKTFLKQVETRTFNEPIAHELAEFLKSKKDETLGLVKRAGQLAQRLSERPPEFILCHADMHGWNLLVDKAGALYLVDWDTLLFAPKERDLMFIGSGLGDSGYTPQAEAAMFYQGYGHTHIDQRAIAYYRSERIIEDIAVYCEQIFLSDSGGDDRKEALENVKSNFRSSGTIELAYQSGKGIGTTL